METGKVDLKIMLPSIAAIVFIEILIGWTSRNFRSIDPLWLVGTARALEIGLILLIVLLAGQSFSVVGLGKDRWVFGIKKGMVWSLVFGGVALMGGIGLALTGVNPIKLCSARLPENAHSLFRLFLIGGIVGPVAEELFFRGICYGFFRRWGIVAAIILTTTVFVTAHTLKSGVPFTQIIGGLVFALAYERENSLMTPIVIHVLANLALFSLSFWPT